MPKVKLVRRWGPYPANRTVEVDDVQAAWLVQHNFAESSGDLKAPEQEPNAEGSHGADPLAGADASRRRPRTIRSTRDHTEGPIAQAEGAPPAAYRAGFTAEDAERQGEAGRNFREGSDDRAGTLSAPEDSPAADGPRATSKAAQSPDQNDEGGGTRNTKPARRRGSRSDS